MIIGSIIVVIVQVKFQRKARVFRISCNCVMACNSCDKQSGHLTLFCLKKEACKSVLGQCFPIFWHSKSKTLLFSVSLKAMTQQL